MALSQDQIIQEDKRRQKVVDEFTRTPEYVDKILNRLKIADAGSRSMEARAHIWNLCARPDNPAEGCIFFIETFLWTFNPKSEPKHFPFILFEFQKRAIRELVDHIDNGRDLFIEKSREMGVSWLAFCVVPLWYWLFREGADFLLGSYKEALVDNKTTDSLFGKIDYELQQLPSWLLPKGFKFGKDRTHMKLYNPGNGNLITGDTMNPQFGRGSRKTAILFDEHGFWDYAKDAWESAADATKCRISNSTPNGYNYYAMLRETGIDILTLLWKEHPFKDQYWYEYECQRRSDEEVAQELDISYSKSKTGRVYPEWNDLNVQIGKYEYDESLPLYISWDFGKTDDTAIIWCQPSRDGLRIIDVYRNTGKNIDFYIPLVTGYIVGDSKYTYSQPDLDLIFEHKNWKNATHFGDPAGRFQNGVTDDTVIDVLKRYGIHINFKDAWKEFKVRKSASKRLIMDRILLNDNSRTRYFNMCMIQASYPQTKIDGVPVTRSDKPAHDSTSHFRSSFEYLSLGIEDLENRKALKPFDKIKKKDRGTRVWGVRRSVGY